MSGVRTVSREAALEALLVRTRQEIACALRREDIRSLPRLRDLARRIELELGLVEPVQPVAAPTAAPYVPVQERLAALGVPAKQVKRRAVEQGLLPAVVRGRIAGWVVDAWAAAHPAEERAS